MNDFLFRQTNVLRQAIVDYRKGILTLNSLIQRIDSIYAVLEDDVWKADIFSITLEMEQINAVALEAKSKLSETNKEKIDVLLVKFEELLKRFETE